MTSKIRHDIQGLRAIAVLSVLLFHLWRQKFSIGFLGVDVFFVISGYLMFAILSSESTNVKSIGHFYFKRLRRLVPIYLFMIFITLITVYFTLPPTEFGNIVKGARPALIFASNFIKTRKDTYFDLDSKYLFFLHCWSLAVEMQFYVLVPFLFILIRLVSKIRKLIGVLLIIAIVIASYIYQNMSSQEHTHLIGRLWQFCFGFLTFYCKKEDNFMIGDSAVKIKRKKRRIFEIVQFIIFTIPLFIEANKSVNRILAVLFTSVIIARQPTNFVLNSKLLVKLGNISYSVYLIHWPLFTLHRFIFMDMYQNEQEATFIVGFTLISISLFLGWTIESIFLKLSKCIQSWKYLLFILFMGYSINFMLLYRLEQKAENIFTESKPSVEWRNEFRQELQSIWKNPNQTLSVNKLIELNTNMIQYGMNFVECEDESDAMSSNFNMNITYLQYICHEKGTGSKNVVLIGNSHAAFNFPGIKYAFKDLYKTLTVIGRDSCYPFEIEFQQKHTQQFLKEYCVNLMLKEFYLVLEQWKEPIDVLIVLIGYSRTEDMKIEGNKMENDRIFKSMQAFYGRLSKIPKQMMIIQSQHMHFETKPSRIIVDHLKYGKSLDNIGNSLEYHLQRFPNMRKRVEAVDCGKKCVKIDWTKLWCPSTNNLSFCSAIEKHRKISYFIDEHHPTAFGSMRQGEYMRKVYNSKLS